MRPDRVAADVLQIAVPHLKISGPFCEQDSSRRVVTARCVARPAVLDARALDAYLFRATHQNREAGDLFEAHAGNRDTAGAFDQNAVTRGESAERRAEIRQTGPLLDRLAIAIDGKVSKPDAGARFGREDGPAAKIAGSSQNRARPTDLHIARAVRQSQLRVNLSDAGRKPHRSRLQRFANIGFWRRCTAGEEHKHDAEAESQRQVKSQKAKVKSQKCIGSACAAQINALDATHGCGKSTLRESKHF